MRLIQIDTRQLLDRDLNAGLFQYLACDTLFEGLPYFEHPAWGFPAPIIATLANEYALVVIDDDPSDAYRERAMLFHTLDCATLDMSSRVEETMETLGTLDKGSDTPTYKQIAALLATAIQDGRYGPGTKLPSETELSAHFAVARMTTRQAISELKVRGLVVSEHGRGVYVSERKPLRRQASERFARRHREAGLGALYVETLDLGTPIVDGLRIERVTPEDEVRERLALKRGALTIRRSRRYLVNDEPIELATTHVPYSIARGTVICDENTGPGGLYARIEESGLRLTRFHEEVTGRMPSLDEQKQLQIEPGVGVFVVTHTAYSGDRPVETTTTVKATNRFILEYDFPAE